MHALFLKKNDLKEVALLHKLYYKDFYLKQDILQELNVSRSTLERYITHINEYFYENNIEPLITSDKTKVAFSVDHYTHSFNTILTHLMKKQLASSHTYKLLTLVVLRKKVSVIDLIDYLFISENYLLKQISNLNTVLGKYDIRLRVTNNEVFLDGEIPNVLLFSFLIHDTHKKLYMINESDLKEVYGTNLEIVKPEFLEGMSNIQRFRANTLQYQFDLYHKEILNYNCPDEIIAELLILYGNEKDMFKSDYRNKINNDLAFGFSTFMIRLLFPPNDLEIDFVIDFFTNKLPGNKLINELTTFSRELSTSLSLIEDRDKKLFKAGLIMTYFHASVFNVNIKADFSNLDEINYLQKNVEIKNNFSIINSLDSKKFPIISPLIIENQSLFNTQIGSTLLIIPPHCLNILLDFESDVSFEYSLKKNILNFFGKDSVAITTEMNKADLIVSDKIFQTVAGPFFFHFSDITSKKTLRELFKLISDMYIDKKF